MTTELSNLKSEFSAGTDLATMLGFGSTGGAVQISALPELSQLYKAEKGQVEVKGKLMTVETIPGGYYCYTDAEGNKTYSETVQCAPSCSASSTNDLRSMKPQWTVSQVSSSALLWLQALTMVT